MQGDQATLLLTEVCGHRLHLAELEGDHDRLARLVSQRLAGGCLHRRIIVAARAVRVVELAAEPGQRQLVCMAHHPCLAGLHGVAKKALTGKPVAQGQQQQQGQQKAFFHGGSPNA